MAISPKARHAKSFPPDAKVSKIETISLAPSASVDFNKSFNASFLSRGLLIERIVFTVLLRLISFS